MFKQLCLGLLLLLNSCSWLSNSSVDYTGATREQLTHLIATMEGAQGMGQELEEWLDNNRREFEIGLYRIPRSGWGPAIGSIYARRSTTYVQHNPYMSPSVLLFLIGVEGMSSFSFFLDGLVFATCGIVIAPFELVASVVSVPVGVVRDLSVSNATIESAVQDLMRARALGYEELMSESNFGWPYSGRAYIDQVGYDADWLTSQQQLDQAK